jgi:siroheme decarboxylase
MTLTFDQHQAQLLDLLQELIPLVERPFAAIAERLDTYEDEVIAAVQQFKAKPRPVIRQISAIFDSRALGYQSCLVAAKVAEALIDAAATVISAHPGVSHNYRRDHAFNLWFTLAVPPDTMLGLERSVDILRTRSGAESMLLLPALKLYKIGVKFGMSADAELPVAPARAARRPSSNIAITPRDQQIIRVLQQDLPIVPRPFDVWAEQAGVSVTDLLAMAEQYVERGVMRRFSAVLRHREAGFGANAMGAWAVPASEHDVFGDAAAASHAVSHCYLRPAHPPEWPYCLFTMVHGRSREECEATLSDICRVTGVTDYATLYSTHEYKKVRIKYFEGDIEKWEQAVQE